jgi:hypothetical protein
MRFKRKVSNSMMCLGRIARHHRFINQWSGPLPRLHCKATMVPYLCMDRQPQEKLIRCWVPKTFRVFCHVQSETYSME